MWYNIYGYSSELLGQIEADDIVSAWDAARLMFIDVLDVREVVEPVIQNGLTKEQYDEVEYYREKGFRIVHSRAGESKEAEAINMVCVQCGRVYKFKPPEIELGVCICGGTEYTREIPI